MFNLRIETFTNFLCSKSTQNTLFVAGKMVVEIKLTNGSTSTRKQTSSLADHASELLIDNY